jgi:hypothetical protein
MIEVDFTSDLWLFASPWCGDKLDDAHYNAAIARAWVALWNFTIDRNSVKKDKIRAM